MRSLKIYLAFAAFILIGYIALQYNAPKVTKWIPTYYDDDKEPFGTFVLRNELGNTFKGIKIAERRAQMTEVLDNEDAKTEAYLVICGFMQPTGDDVTSLKNYVSAGNTVFIAAESFGNAFRDSLGIACENYFADEKAPEFIRFTNKHTDTERQYHIDEDVITNYFTSVDTAATIVLGVNDKNQANFVRLPIGKGNLYLSANPKMFTNYSLLKDQGELYSSIALSYLGSPSRIIWDQFYTQGANNINSPLRFLLDNDPLRAAMYIALFGLIVFVLYELKRRQRIIPVVVPVVNSSLEFVNVVGGVYFERRDNMDISFKKIHYFLTDVRERYFMRTNKIDEEFITTLTKKTGIDAQFIRDMANYMNFIFGLNTVSDEELIELNKLIEKFNNLSA